MTDDGMTTSKDCWRNWRPVASLAARIGDLRSAVSAGSETSAEQGSETRAEQFAEQTTSMINDQSERVSPCVTT